MDAQLNPPQREAVETLEGPLLVLAGAGSGKTRVITHRIANLIRHGVPSRSILAVTFTNKAAAEMKQRVIKLAGSKAQGATVSTFHAFGAELLREEIGRLGWPKRFAIADTGDQISLVRRAMRERNIDDRSFDARKVLAGISRAKGTGQPPKVRPEGQGDDYDLICSEVYPLYQRALRAQGAVDFDDLILLAVTLLRDHPPVQEKLRGRFRYLLVDEYQDTNAAQLELLRLLSGQANNVCAVGDDDQCIYSWRGADIHNILRFASYFGGKEIRLEQNYRSSEVILGAANAVIEKAQARKPKRLWTDRQGGDLIQLVVAPDEEEEGRYVAGEIAKLIREGLTADEVAVLYRTNGQSRPVEEALRERGITFEVVGGSEFFDRREVKDVLGYLKAIANPKDEVSLLRIVNVPARGIGDVTMERLLAWAKEKGIGLWEAMEKAALAPDLPTGAAEKVGQFVSMIAGYRGRFAKDGNLFAVAAALLEEIGFGDSIRSIATSATQADRKLKSVDQLLRSIQAHQNREGPKAELLTYLNRLSLDTKEEEDVPGPDGRVRLMTLHSAKGLEFQVVFLIGMEEDLLPHGGMQGEPQNLDEERRLCYVGITRARRRLYLTRAAARLKRGKLVPRTPSRFLLELPTELTTLVDLLALPPGPPTEKEKAFFSDLKNRLKGQAP